MTSLRYTNYEEGEISYPARKKRIGAELKKWPADSIPSFEILGVKGSYLDLGITGFKGKLSVGPSYPHGSPELIWPQTEKQMYDKEINNWIWAFTILTQPCSYLSSFDPRNEDKPKRMHYHSLNCPDNYSIKTRLVEYSKELVFVETYDKIESLRIRVPDILHEPVIFNKIIEMLL